MKARKPKASKVLPTAGKASKPALPPQWRGHDLTTVEGSKAALRTMARRKRIAMEVHSEDFAEVHTHLDDIDRRVGAIMADLVGRDMYETIGELSRLIRSAYMIRIACPEPKAEKAGAS